MQNGFAAVGTSCAIGEAKDTTGGLAVVERSLSDDERLEPDAIVTKRSLEGLDAADTNWFVAVVASLGEHTELSSLEDFLWD